MKRMYSLDLLRLVMAYIIALFHVGVLVNPGPTVCVEMFFIISGYFLAKKFYSTREQEYNQWQYTIEHAKSLYPHYIFAVIVFFLYVTVRSLVHFISNPSWNQLYDMLLLLYNQIPDVLLLQSAYHFHDSLNYPAWQISALLIAGYFVFGLLRHNEKTSRMLIFPAAILMARSIMNTGIDRDMNFGPIYMELLVAFSCMCIGVLAYYFTFTSCYGVFKGKKVLFNISSVAALFCIFFFGEYDLIHLIITPLVIYGCLEPDSWINYIFNRSCFRKFGSFSYVIYVNHAMIQRLMYGFVFPKIDTSTGALSDPIKAGIYVFAVTIYSVITVFLVNWIRKNAFTQRKNGVA